MNMNSFGTDQDRLEIEYGEEIVVSTLHQRVEEILNESSDFIIACEERLKKTKEFGTAVQYYIEEAIIREAEGIVNKAKPLAILKLVSTNPNDAVRNSIIGETKIIRKMLSHLISIPISDEYHALQALQSKLLRLSFLPTADPV
jgi:hypothetical protein